MLESVANFFSLTPEKQVEWVKRHTEDEKVMTLIWQLEGVIKGIENKENRKIIHR